MRPLFTVHAGEFLVGEFIERQFPALRLWIPAKDTGVDLLVTNKSASKSVSLQVKLSRDYKKPEAIDEFDKTVVAAGWFIFNHKKLENSPADWWVIVLVSAERRGTPKYIVIEPKELLKKLVATHGKSERYHIYPWTTNAGKVMDGRGLLKSDRAQLAAGTFELGFRDLTKFLNNWDCLRSLN